MIGLSHAEGARLGDLPLPLGGRRLLALGRGLGRSMVRFRRGAPEKRPRAEPMGSQFSYP